ncbi:MAG: UDP-N-acetylglucosamine diphosphorylase, partial [Candidatus Zixiibacteriota bacterium]
NELFNVHTKNSASATCLSADFDDPTGYGRIIRQPGSDILLEIIEEKDADSMTRQISEINTGTFCFSANDLFSALHKVGNDNVQKEYYLTDTVKILRNSGMPCAVVKTADPVEVRGINSLAQLKALEKEIKS